MAQPPNQNRALVFAILIVAVFAAGGYCFLRFASQPATAEPLAATSIPTPTPNPVSTAGWVSYSGNHFTVTHPSGWKVGDNQCLSSAATTAKLATQTQATIPDSASLSIPDLCVFYSANASQLPTNGGKASGASSLAKYLEAESAKAASKQSGKVSSYVTAMIGANSGYFASANFAESDLLLGTCTNGVDCYNTTPSKDQKVYFVEKNGAVYTILLGTSDHDPEKAILEQVVASLELQ